MKLYSFSEFLKEIKDLDWHEMITKANTKYISLESGSYRVKGAVNKRKAGAIDLAEKIKGLLFWLQNRIKPAGLTNSEFQMLRPLCVKLVEKKQLKEEDLVVFDKNNNEF